MGRRRRSDGAQPNSHSRPVATPLGLGPIGRASSGTRGHRACLWCRIVQASISSSEKAGEFDIVEFKVDEPLQFG